MERIRQIPRYLRRRARRTASAPDAAAAAASSAATSATGASPVETSFAGVADAPPRPSADG